MLHSLRERKEWKFFGVLPKADRALAVAWWLVLVGTVQRGDNLAGPLTFAGGVFILLQVLTPIHQAVSANLGDRTAAWLYDRLTEACVRPPGMGHLEDAKLTNDLTVARDFDTGMTAPPLSVSMNFIASGLVEMIGGLSCAVRRPLAPDRAHRSGGGDRSNPSTPRRAGRDPLAAPRPFSAHRA
jgi:ATP-binding cassette subfamily B protein